MKEKSPKDQLDSFIAEYSPEVAARARAALAHLRQKLDGSIEIVYDNYNALAIGFGPTERASDAILSIALYPRWVSLFFLQANGLPDPHGILKGKGTKSRHVVLESPETLETPAVQALIKAALERANAPLDPNEPHRIVIKAVSAKQRPRRPA
jgi:hypothetical protein